MNQDDDLEDEDDENPQETAAALIQMLDDDVERLIARYDKLLDTMSAEGVTPEKFQEYDGKWRSLTREIFRAFFAYVEGTVYSLKQYAHIQLGVLDQPLEPHEVDAVIECTWRMRISRHGRIACRAWGILREPNQARQTRDKQHHERYGQSSQTRKPRYFGTGH